MLWKVDGDDLEVDPVSRLYKMKTEEPTNKFNYKEIDKIRCMNFMRKRNVSLCLSLKRFVSFRSNFAVFGEDSSMKVTNQNLFEFSGDRRTHIQLQTAHDRCDHHAKQPEALQFDLRQRPVLYDAERRQPVRSRLEQPHSVGRLTLVQHRVDDQLEESRMSNPIDEF